MGLVVINFRISTFQKIFKKKNLPDKFKRFIPLPNLETFNSKI
jgi:hypothetical protein